MDFTRVRRRFSVSLHRETPRKLALLAARRKVALGLVLACVVIDSVITWHGMSFVWRALIDEPCHLATALVVLGAITRFRGHPPDAKFCWAMLASSVLIDLDHLPLEFGSSVLTAGTPRPYTHALWVVVVLAAATLAARYGFKAVQMAPLTTAEHVLAGATTGISAHFLRDVATAQMAVWWPLSDTAVQIPYWWYPTALLVLVAVPLAGWRKDGPIEAGRTERPMASANEPRGRSDQLMLDPTPFHGWLATEIKGDHG